MSDFEIFADSAANLPDELVALHGIHILPFNLIAEDGTEFPSVREGVPSREVAKEFYNNMRAGKEYKTSLISEESFYKAARTAVENGKDAVIVTMSAGISGTYEQAVKAANALTKEFPDRKVYVVDSANASLGEGLIVLRIADLRALGESAQSCFEWAVNNVYKLNSYVTVEDLKYLRKGGRISKTLAIAGSLLSIKPIIRADGSDKAKLTFFSKTRGRKKALASLVEYFDKLAVRPESQTVAIAHADCEDEANELAETLKAHGAQDVIVEYYDICTGSHIGPGTIAVFFMGKDRRTELPSLDAIASVQPAPKTSKV